MKNKFFLRKEVNRIRNHIQSAFPHAYEIDVKIQKKEKGLFRSLIKVRAPDKKEMIAVKTDTSPKKSLEKSHMAIIKQVHKVKTRWKKSNQQNTKKLMAA